MSFLFDDASTQYLTVNSSVITGPPFTIFAVGRGDDSTNHHLLASLSDESSAGTHVHLLNMNKSSEGQAVKAFSKDASGGAAATTVATWTQDVDHYIAGVWTSTASRAVYIDFRVGLSDNKGTSTGTETPTNIDTISIGAWKSTTVIDPASGNISEVAFWNVALSDVEIEWLSLGHSPLSLTHRIGNLIVYRDLIRGLDRPGIGPAFTNVNGATVGVHPRMIYPSRSRGIHVPTAAVGGLSIPIANYHYRQLARRR